MFSPRRHICPIRQRPLPPIIQADETEWFLRKQGDAYTNAAYGQSPVTITDRLLGYGFKYDTGFQTTHFQRV